MGMGDEVYDMEDNLSTLTSPIFSDDDGGTETPDAKETYTISLLDVIAETNAKTPKPPNTAKKRVQFLPDGILVRIREIPPRSNKSSSESEGSASDTSDSEGSDSDSGTDTDETTSSERDTPSPGPTESENKFSTMPPLVYAAKGSYNISKQSNGSGGKTQSPVSKITGLDPNIHKKPVPKRTRRAMSPRLDKKVKRVANNSNNNSNNKNNKSANNKNINPKNENTKVSKKRTPLKIKEGKVSPPPFSKFSKNNGSKSHQKSNTQSPIVNKLPQRRALSANDTNKISQVTRSNRTSHSAVSTSLTSLPSSVPNSHHSLDHANRAMKSLTLGNLYTVDGFIFPSHHATDLHLPDLSPISKSEDFEICVSLSPTFPPAQRRPSLDQLSPKRPSQDVSSHGNQGHGQPTPPQSANRKKRHYAWQLANGSPQNALASTPSISQLWENPGRSNSKTESSDKTITGLR